MKKRAFFLNYGAASDTPALVFARPGSPISTSEIIQANQDIYGLHCTLLKARISGLDVTVIAHGPHRSLEISLDLGGNKAGRRQYLDCLSQNNVTTNNQAERKMAWCEGAVEAIPQIDALAIYGQLLDIAQQLVERRYNLLKHNCITAVAMILHHLDNRLCPQDLIFPPTLDRFISRYCQRNSIHPSYDQTKQPTLALFWRHYRREVGPADRRHGLFAPKRYFERFWAESVMDVVHHLYGLHAGCSGSRTKSVLVNSNWIEAKRRRGFYRAASNAPEDFKQALAVCNKELLAHKQRKTADLDYSEPMFGFGV